MITRVQDYSCFNDEVFNKLNQQLNKTDKIKLANANNFKKVAWGEYLYAGFTGSNGYQDKYAFDDGAIWYVETDEQGNEYLVKQIDDNDEIVRIANNNIYINENNMCKVAQLLNVNGINNDTVKFMKNDIVMFKSACKTLTNKLIDYIKTYSTNKHYTEDRNKLKNTVITASKCFNNIRNLNDLNIIIDKEMN